MHKGDGCDLEIHRTDAKALSVQSSEHLCSLLVEQENIPTRKEVEQPEQFPIRRDLSTHSSQRWINANHPRICSSAVITVVAKSSSADAFILFVNVTN